MKSYIANTLLICLILLYSSAAFSKKTHQSSDGSQAFTEYVGILNEFTDRRRSHVLFDNTQSADHGLQVGHVKRW